MIKILSVLASLCPLVITCQTEARSVDPKSIVPDIDDFIIVKAFRCNPPGQPTRMCLVIEKDGRQLMSVHDIDTRRPLELRDEKKVIWSHAWEVV